MNVYLYYISYYNKEKDSDKMKDFIPKYLHITSWYNNNKHRTSIGLNRENLCDKKRI